MNQALSVRNESQPPRSASPGCGRPGGSGRVRAPVQPAHPGVVPARNLQDADTDDVTQVVLTKLTSQVRSFRYDPGLSYRAYVRKVAHHTWCDFLTWPASRGRVAAVSTASSQPVGVGSRPR